MSGSSVVLSVNAVSVRFGGLLALDQVSLQFASAQLCAVIGPNGAGKTTLFHALCRQLPVASGTMHCQGQSLLPLQPHEVAALGLARTHQHAAVFPSLSVGQHVLLGREALRHRPEVVEAQAWQANVVEGLALAPHWHQPVGELPLNLQRRVELAKALVSQPRVLLLDEPAAGQTHDEWQACAQLLRQLLAQVGTSVLLVEHRLAWVWPLADRCVVLDQGRVIADGSPDAVRADERVIQAYLGAQHVGA